MNGNPHWTFGLCHQFMYCTIPLLASRELDGLESGWVNENSWWSLHTSWGLLFVSCVLWEWCLTNSKKQINQYIFWVYTVRLRSSLPSEWVSEYCMYVLYISLNAFKPIGSQGSLIDFTLPVLWMWMWMVSNVPHLVFCLSIDPIQVMRSAVLILRWVLVLVRMTSDEYGLPAHHRLLPLYIISACGYPRLDEMFEAGWSHVREVLDRQTDWWMVMSM